MNFKETINFSGRLDVKLFDKDGNIKESFTVNNMIVHAGKQLIIRRLKDAVTAPVRYMAIGIGDTPQVSSDTGLETEVSRLSIPTPVDADTTLTFTGVFPPANGEGEITEAGLFNADTGGIMLARTTFPAVVKEELDTLAISWHITLS